MYSSFRPRQRTQCPWCASTPPRHSPEPHRSKPSATVPCRAGPFPPILLRQRLVQFPLIEVLFFRIERPRINHAYLFPVGPIHTENSDSAYGPAQVEEPRLDRKPS